MALMQNDSRVVSGGWLWALLLGLCFLSGCVLSSLEQHAVMPQQTTPQSYTDATPYLRIETGLHTAVIKGIDVDIQERFLVTASEDKTARVWDLNTGKLLQILRPPIGSGREGHLYAVAMSPDGETVAVGGFTGQSESGMPGTENIYLFNRSNGLLQRRITGLPNVVNHLAYSLDGRYLAAALGGESGIRVYRTDDFSKVLQDTDYSAASNWIEFDREDRLLSTSWDGYLRLYDANFKRIAKQKAPGGKEPYAARFSPTGDKVAVGFDDSTAVNVLSGQDLLFLYAPETHHLGNGNLRSIAWGQDGQQLYSGGRYIDGTDTCPILKWSKSDSGKAEHWIATATNTVTDIRALKNNRLVFSASDTTFGVLDATGRKQVSQTSSIVDHRINTTKLQVSQKAELLHFDFITKFLTGEWQSRTAQLDLDQQQFKLFSIPSPVLKTTLTPPRTIAPGLTISGWYNTTALTLNGQDLKLRGHEISRSLAITPDSQYFLLGTEWCIRFFNRQGQQQWRVPAPDIAWAVNISGDGKLGVAAFGDGTIRWYRLTDGQELLAFFPHADGKRWVAWTPEGFFTDGDSGGKDLIGYHLNQGPDKAGDFVAVTQLYEQFYRPDLVAKALKPEARQEITNALASIGDVRKVLAGGLPPELELVSQKLDGLNLLLSFRIKVRSGGVGKLVLRMNGVDQEARGISPGVAGLNPLNISMPLPLGKNTVTISAYNRDNTVESNLARSIKVTQNFNAVAVKRPSLYVLAIGVSHYKDQDMNLKYSAADAKSMGALLNQQGQGLFERVQVKPLLDQDANLANIQAAFSELAGQVQENDVFLLYLAGHGLVLNGNYHFVPYDAVYRSEQAMHEASLDEQKLQDLLKTIRAQKSLIVLDTCYAGKLKDLPMTLASRGLDQKTALSRLSRATGRAILAASSDKQLALEGYDGHGFFTHAMLQGLQGSADSNHNGEINTLELANFVSEEVPRLSADRQFPVHESQGEPFSIGVTH